MWEIIFLLLGLIVGSFANVVIFRLIKQKNILGRSVCHRCLKQLNWYENIPVLSFIFLRGKCLGCRQKISWQYPLVELASGILWLVAWLVFTDLVPALVFGVFSTILLILFVFDLRWYILPDLITIPGIILALLLNLLLGQDWLWLVGAGAIGAAWFLLQYVLSHGKWVGSGDIRLGALMGVMLASWQGLLVALLLAYLAGSVVAVVLVALKKKEWQSQIPFGTFLTVATIITLGWGGQLWDWYLGLVW